MSMATRHLQQITDSGQEPEPEASLEHNYGIENEPVEWTSGNAQEHYDFISEIARGKYSAVMKAVDKRSDKVVVAKILETTGDRADHVEGEFAALRSLRHERIASLLDAYKASDGPIAVFILEKLQGADVITYLATKHEYTEQTVATIVTQVNKFVVLKKQSCNKTAFRSSTACSTCTGGDCAI